MNTKILTATLAAALLVSSAASATGSRQSNDNNVYQGATAGAGALSTSKATGVGLGVATGGTGGNGAASLDATTTFEGDDYPALGVLIGPGDFSPGSAASVRFGTRAVILQDSTKLAFFAWSRQRVEPLPQYAMEMLGNLDAYTDAQLSYVCFELGFAEHVRAGTGCPGDTYGDLR